MRDLKILFKGIFELSGNELEMKETGNVLQRNCKRLYVKGCNGMGRVKEIVSYWERT